MPSSGTLDAGSPAPSREALDTHKVRPRARPIPAPGHGGSGVWLVPSWQEKGCGAPLPHPSPLRRRGARCRLGGRGGRERPEPRSGLARIELFLALGSAGSGRGQRPAVTSRLRVELGQGGWQGGGDPRRGVSPGMGDVLTLERVLGSCPVLGRTCDGPVTLVPALLPPRGGPAYSRGPCTSSTCDTRLKRDPPAEYMLGQGGRSQCQGWQSCCSPCGEECPAVQGGADQGVGTGCRGCGQLDTVPPRAPPGRGHPSSCWPAGLHCSHTLVLPVLQPLLPAAGGAGRCFRRDVPVCPPGCARVSAGMSPARSWHS